MFILHYRIISDLEKKKLSQLEWGPIRLRYIIIPPLVSGAWRLEWVWVYFMYQGYT